MKSTPHLRAISLALTGILMLFATACQTSSVDSVQRAVPMADPNVVDDERITSDRSLSRILEIRQINEATVSNGHLRVQVELRNTRRALRRFNYQFEWFDNEGMIVQQATTPWRSLQIEGGEIVTISGIAPNARVVDFRLKLMTTVR